MQALFVHGMGRSPLSAWPLLRHLRRAGLKTHTFGYWVSLESYANIRARLISSLARLARRDRDYILIGHSLGGVLLRDALQGLPDDTTRPQHLFLLGSPVHPSRLAKRFGQNPVFRALTGDCGQLLGSAERMSGIGPVADASTAIAGTRGFVGSGGYFAREPNDGVVAVSEVSADWIADQIRIPEIHTQLPSSRRVAEIILARIGRTAPPQMP